MHDYAMRGFCTDGQTVVTFSIGIHPVLRGITADNLSIDIGCGTGTIQRYTTYNYTT